MEDGVQTNSGLQELDGIIVRTAKGPHDCPYAACTSTPTGLMLERHIACGVWVECLLPEHVQLGPAYLVRASNSNKYIRKYFK